jgi:glycosyltransferase involved in cell wall biosynthesis
MEKILVSAVIITYNHEKFIEQTIKCALAQHVDFGYEIIIGEDCSTDNTRQICLDYQKKYPSKIKVITSEYNVGLMDNFYRTVSSAKGKYFAVCGGDDFWHDPKKLMKQVKTMEKKPECGMVHSDENVLYDDTGELLENYNIKTKRYYDNNLINTLDLLFSGRYKIVASSALYKTSLFRKHFNLNELKNNNVIIEDMPLFIHIAAHSRIYYLSESLVTRRVVNGSITRQGFDNSIKLWESVYSCYLLLYEKYKNNIVDDDIDIRTIHALANRLMFRTAFKANHKVLARNFYRNIMILAGKKYLKNTDTIRYYATFLPFGIFSTNLIIVIYQQIRFLLTGQSSKGV